MIWNATNVERIILDMAGAILKKPHAGYGSVTPPLLDLHYDLGMDSIQRMSLAASLNEFFGLFATTVDSFLLADTTLSHWTNCILRGRQHTDNSLTFRTSGTSGAARPVRHTLAALLAEAHVIAQLLPRPTRVVSTVPAQHLYGFIFTVLLPALWERPLCLLADVVLSDLGPDTLIIGTPFTWEFIRRSLPLQNAISVRGVSSTAPMSPGLFTQLADMGIGLTEIYGSSETSGLAYRNQPDHPFSLLPHLSLRPGNPATVTRADTGDSCTIPDELELVSDRQFWVKGRLDGAFQIAGVNVYPGRIRQVISECPLVATCDIHVKAEQGVRQLYGAVQLRVHTEANREACLRWMREQLSAPEMPEHLYLY
jgi:long-chain acyl-CoA synthetase